ncbi:MAG: 30S ribosomal protein S6 [Myxococcales bacterium]|nr:MAG: 30S ribosomal protein S6 [Myxococcales bacterium]
MAWTGVVPGLSCKPLPLPRRQPSGRGFIPGRSLPMHLREYETIFILRPDVGDEGMSQVVERVKGVLGSKGAVLLREQNWGKKKLAYEIDKHLKGIYHYLDYAGQPGTVEEVERILKIVEAVIRYQTVKVTDIESLDARRAEIQKEAEDEERRRREREERESLPAPPAAVVNGETAAADAAGDAEDKDEAGEDEVQEPKD